MKNEPKTKACRTSKSAKAEADVEKGGSKRKSAADGGKSKRAKASRGQV